VTGIGGIFFKCKDPQQLKNWYEEHLGFNTDEYGTNFEWRQMDEQKGFTQWSPFLIALNTSRHLIRSL
jgi:catechol 2,3-dioxygenase-like lactoylglutathione lyase family enzyme